MKKMIMVRKETIQTFVFTQDEIEHILLNHLSATGNILISNNIKSYLNDDDCTVTLEIYKDETIEK